MKILLVDDDRDLVDLLRYAFQRDGYTPLTAFDGPSALRVFELESPDLVVLDMVIPKRSGMDVLQELRRRSQVPILVLTAMGDEDHVVNALRLGADDYLSKPFRPRELRARVEALIRRSHSVDHRESRTSRPIQCGQVTLDPRRWEVSVGDRAVRLTRNEFELLHYLMLNRGVVVSPSDIISNVWGYDAEESEDVVKVTMSRLRRKLEPDPSHPCFIVTVHGVGYTLRDSA